MQDLDLDLALVLKQTQSESAVVVKPFLVIHLFVQNLKLDKLNMSHLTSMHKSKDPAKGHKYETFFPPRGPLIRAPVLLIYKLIICFHQLYVSLNQATVLESDTYQIHGRAVAGSQLCLYLQKYDCTMCTV